MKRKILLGVVLGLCIYSCGKKESTRKTKEPTYEYEQNSEQYSGEIFDTVKLEKNTGVEKIELPENILIRKEDISVRTSLKPHASIVKRFTYKFLVSDKIKREQIKPLFTKLIKDITLEDNDIDDITVWLYSDKELALSNQAYDVAMATWMPAHNREITDEIALSNNRDKYELSITINDKLENYLKIKSEKKVRSGLSYDLRKNIYQELAETESKARKKADKIYPYTTNFNTDKYANKLDEITKKYEKEICKKYKIDTKTMNMIYEEGDKNNWYNF